jgi:hypothetical protein
MVVVEFVVGVCVHSVAVCVDDDLGAVQQQLLDQSSVSEV